MSFHSIASIARELHNLPKSSNEAFSDPTNRINRYFGSMPLKPSYTANQTYTLRYIVLQNHFFDVTNLETFVSLNYYLNSHFLSNRKITSFFLRNLY